MSRMASGGIGSITSVSKTLGLGVREGRGKFVRDRGLSINPKCQETVEHQDIILKRAATDDHYYSKNYKIKE